MDTTQLLVYLGFLLLFLHRPPDPREWAGALFAVGGFLLYLAWEAKSQYALPMIQLMVPYSAAGLILLVERTRRYARTLNQATHRLFDHWNIS